MAMAKPQPSRKEGVKLTAPATPVSRIRRDPPPPPSKPVSAAEVREREAFNICLGVAVFALAMIVALYGLTNAAGWSPSQYTIESRE